MLIAPLIALLLVLASSASHAHCLANSWDFQPNIPGSDLDPSDFEWLKDRRFSKQKFGMDFTGIKSKNEMSIIKSSAYNVLGIDSLGNMTRPRPQSATEKLKNISTRSGFELIEDEKTFPRIGPIGYCHKNFKIQNNDSFSVDIYYHIVGLRYGYEKGSPINTRRLIFIKQDGEWLFDRLGDNSDLPKFK